jgi:hypothetical protein
MQRVRDNPEVAQYPDRLIYSALRSITDLDTDQTTADLIKFQIPYSFVNESVALRLSEFEIRGA